MSGNLGPQASTKGETTSKTTSKTGYDRLDINKLYKGKTAEPVAKTVTQKHGMQTLGKAPPARRAGASLVKSEPTSNDTNNSSVPTQLQQQQQQQQQQTPSSNLGQPVSQQQKWANTSHPQVPPPPSPLSAPNVPSTGQPMHDKSWSGQDGGNYQSQRFAQEFPTLDAGSEPTRGGSMNTTQQQLPTATGLQNTSSQDNQYGPGPILRPQTEGSWTQGGGRGMPRPPPGPPVQNTQIREQGPERPNLGGPTPPPMSLGQGGPAPPPLGAYPMQYRGMPQFMYPNSGPPPGPGYYPPPPGQGMPRYGMPVPPGAPPTRDHSESHPNRGRGPPPIMRPTQQFAVKPILKQEDLKRMDDIDLEGSWASVRDDVDYNKRISFSDDESEEKRGDSSRKSAERKAEEENRQDHRDRKPVVRILERQLSNTHDRDHRYENTNKEQGNYEQDNEDDWNKRRSNAPYDIKDRGARKINSRDPRDDDWRGNSRFEDDPRNKKGPPSRMMDPRGPPDFTNKQYNSNLPPRLLRQQQQHTNQPFSVNQRKTPSPVSSTPAVSGKDRDRDFPRERDKAQSTTQYRILERNRGDSESSNNSIREKRGGNNEYESRSYDKEPNNRLNSETNREKEKETESLKEKNDCLDIRGDMKRLEESKVAFRSKSGFSSSWADEVDDEDYSKDFEDVRKHTSPLKPDTIQLEERTVPKRVYIQQRKVENMTTAKAEPQPEQPKQCNNDTTPKQEKPTERQQRPTAWGERETREKSRNETDNNTSPVQKGEDERERSKEPSKTSEREIILSEKAKQLVQHNRDESNVEKSDKMHHQQQQQQEIERPTRDFERKDRNERPDFDKGKYSQKIDSRQDRDRGMSYNKDRQRQGRWGSNDFRRDNRTPEKDYNVSSGRSSATDSSASLASAKASTEGEINRTSTSEKGKSVEIINESSVNIEKEHFEISKDRDDLKSKDYDKLRERDLDKRNRHLNDDSEVDNRGNQKGGRNRETRERVGHGVYQPRGGWGRQGQDSRGKSRGGRDNYDRPRRNDYDREKDDRGLREELRDSDSIKEKSYEGENESVNEEVKRDGGLSEEDRSKKEREREAGTGGDQNKKSSKSPVSNKRNVRGGSRLQGYGPPSDKNPFSSGNSNKEEESNKDKQVETVNKNNNNPLPTTGPVPLMELGDISPPNNMPSRQRHHGNRGRGITTRLQDSSYPYRGGGGSKRGRGDAKPLMSITSNELDRNDWESGSETGDEEVKKSSTGGSKSKKDGNKVPAEKYRHNQNETRNTSKDKTNSSANSSASANGFEQANYPINHDTINNNKGKAALMTASGTSNSDLDSYSSATAGEPVRPGSTSDNSENVDGENYQSGQNKKNIPAKDKSNFSSSKNLRNDKQQGQGMNKEQRRPKNPPYEVRPSSVKDIPPRFQKQQHGSQSQFLNSNSKGSDGSNSTVKESTQTSNAWEKPVVSVAKIDHNSQPSTQIAATLNTDSADAKSLSVAATSGAHVSAGNTSTILDGTGGPLKTMIFENRNYKSVSKPVNSVKLTEPSTTKDSNLTSSIELPRDIALGIGKIANEDSPELDFTSAFDEQNTLQPQTSQSMQSSKPMPIGQSRTYPSHQPSPISPLAADLNEKIQSVKRVWDPPSMPSVAEQTGVCGSEENAFHGGFGSDSFKSTESSNRDYSSSLQQSSSGYAPGHSPALSAISKPDSSTSPNSTNLRQVKPQQQSSMENQSHGGMSSSPFAYSMPQQHQGGAFGGIPAVPSPPAVMYGTSQTLHAAHTGVYQAFPHVEPSQVMNTTARSQFGQYSNPQAAGGGGPYSLGGIFMTSMDAGYQPLSSFQHSHQQQHSQSVPQGQAPNQSSRISPGPMSTSGGGSGGTVMMNSSNLKSQGGTGNHQNLSHQHQVMSGTHNQQGYSQISHHHANAMTHHQHPVGPVGPNKTTGYAQSGIATQSQLFIPFDPNQQPVINLGQNYISSGIRSAPQGGPPPSQTPPVQGLQASSTYYSGNAGNQVYHTGSNQGGNLQQLHVAVAPNQALQNLQTATQQFGLQFQSPLNLQGYNQQAATTVSALNLGGQLIRSGPPGHSHYNMKQPGLELVQQSQLKSHESMMNQTWNTQGFSLNQGFHTGNKSGNSVDRNAGNNIGNQRKGNHQMGNMGSMGGMKYMPNTSGYPTQKGGRFPASGFPAPIQRPVSTSPSTGPSGSLNPVPSGVPQSAAIGVGSGAVKPKHLTNDNLNKHLNQSSSGVEGQN